jgi:glycosyltransferase involved in cell wall biosynthesis
MIASGVSVVIPTYNAAELVCETVRSALAQTAPPAEVIVIDDGSSDDTRQRLASFGKPVRYIYQENQGVSAARNRGIHESTGEFIAFLDADDVWHPRKLERQVAVLNAHPEFALVGTRVVDWPGENFPPDPENEAASPSIVPLEKLAVRNYLVTSSVMVRRAVLGQVGDFDRSLHGPEDYDLWLRVAQLAAVANLPLPLTGYRDVQGSISKQAVRMEAGMQAILGKLEAAGVFHRRPLLRRKAWSHFYYSTAYMHGVAGNRSAALRNSYRALTSFPFPYQRGEVKMRFARARLFVTSLRRWLTSSRPEGAGETASRPAPQEQGVAS